MRWCNWTGWAMITDSALIHCLCLEKQLNHIYKKYYRKFLDANDIDYEIASSKKKLEVADIAEKA